MGSKAPVENASNSSIHENTKEVNSIYKKDEVVTQEAAENSVAQQYARSSNISIADILEKIKQKVHPFKTDLYVGGCTFFANNLAQANNANESSHTLFATFKTT